MQDTYEYYEQLRLNQGEEPKKINLERFDDMLNVLPPCKWSRGSITESFFISEAETEDLHRWFARIDNHYFELVAPRSLRHEDIIMRIALKFNDINDYFKD